ncbi:hypothetical protein OGAPHI_000823 [Ogataea philodendri]|uniref:Uncharacterized protein n=1 Tax=Ogataea philodendri TaxID=1378263 RepID=A0A9P8PH10_9ASCO|nr:uncharacterized protein OGAPHI_000823 [Ogataea philodendri]KAH3671112.1 hypothetical protein OGAPHI_000823 [Ogataea philodendri]
MFVRQTRTLTLAYWNTLAKNGTTCDSNTAANFVLCSSVSLLISTMVAKMSNVSSKAFKLSFSSGAVSTSLLVMFSRLSAICTVWSSSKPLENSSVWKCSPRRYTLERSLETFRLPKICLTLSSCEKASMKGVEIVDKSYRNSKLVKVRLFDRFFSISVMTNLGIPLATILGKMSEWKTSVEISSERDPRHAMIFSMKSNNNLRCSPDTFSSLMWSSEFLALLKECSRTVHMSDLHKNTLKSYPSSIIRFLKRPNDSTTTSSLESCTSLVNIVRIRSLFRNSLRISGSVSQRVLMAPTAIDRSFVASDLSLSSNGAIFWKSLSSCGTFCFLWPANLALLDLFFSFAMIKKFLLMSTQNIGDIPILAIMLENGASLTFRSDS